MVESKVERAKQFLPFDSLKGFREALRKKEEEYVDKIELSEEMQEQLSKKLVKIEKGMQINITYYNRKYIHKQGIVKRINYKEKTIVLEDETKIFFDDIYEIEKNL